MTGLSTDATSSMQYEHSRTFDLPLALFFIAFILLAVIHAIALQLLLYWIYPWFDIPMHMLGGMVIALGAGSTLFMRITRLSFPTLGRMLVLVFCIGLLWEVFEWQSGLTQPLGIDMLDTVKDLFDDLFGGAIGYGMVRVLTTFK